MSNPDWRPLATVNFRSFHAARVQAHYAAQWLARAARAHVPAQPHDGHTSLAWDDRFGGLTTHPLHGGVRVGLRLADLTLVVLGSAPQMLALDGRADPEVRTWLGEQLAGRGLDPAALDAPVPYDMPDHVLGLGARYSLDELHDQFAALPMWYADAHAMLGRIGRKLTPLRLKPAPVRCWPHHFDLDSVVELGRDRGIGLGFSPGDEYCDEPYFYVTMYPEPRIPGLPLLPPIGHWHTHEFLAAFAPAHKIAAATDQAGYTEAFFDTAVEGALKALR